MQHFATAVSCGVEDIGQQPLQRLSAQHDLRVNRNITATVDDENMGLPQVDCVL